MIHTYRESKDVANALENEGRDQFTILTMYTTLPLPLPSVAKGFDSNYINVEPIREYVEVPLLSFLYSIRRDFQYLS